MVGTNHVSVEDVQIDKACVFQQKIITLWSFNHSSQIKPKYFPETKTLAYQFFDLKEIFAKINEHSHEWNFDGGKHGGGSGRNDALREYYIQLCNKWTPKIVFLGKNYRVGDFLSSDFRPLSVGGYPPFYVKKCPLLFWENIVRGISVTFFIDYFSKFDPCHPHLRSFFLLFCRPRSIILASNLLLVWRKNSSHL